MHICLLQVMTEGLKCKGGLFSVDGCLTVGPCGSCECTLHRGTYDFFGMHITHINW